MFCFRVDVLPMFCTGADHANALNGTGVDQNANGTSALQKMNYGTGVAFVQ